MKKKISSKIPIILAILFFLFLAMFSLDVFDGNSSTSQILIGLFLHNIPVIILGIVIFLSIKRPIIGAVTFSLFGLAYIVLISTSAITGEQFHWYVLSYSLIIAGPAFLISYLFYRNHKKKKK